MFDVIRRTDKNCEKHDLDYEEIVTKFGPNEVVSKCPECQKEAEAEGERKRQEDLAAELKERNRQDRLKRIQRITDGSAIPPRYLTRTFSNYRVETEGQERVQAAVKDYAEGFKRHLDTGAGLILAGRPGTGKTHLACALANHLIHELELCPVFVTASKMIRKIRETYRRDSELTEQQMIDMFRDADLLIIDEVGVQRGTESEEHLLFEVLNERNAHFRPTVLISNLNASEIKTYIGERAMDRMREGGGKFVVLDWDSYRGKVAQDLDLPTAKACVPAKSLNAPPAWRPFDLSQI